jgi:uridine phosphorylase
MMSNTPPILRAKAYNAPSIFKPENLLRESRRQRNQPPASIPDLCLLDPDGDILQWLQRHDRATFVSGWACYHTELHQFDLDGKTVGIIGRAVGASFAVLLAEQLFASGCKLLLSMTSAGKIARDLEAPCFVLIEKALRDEGTSYHYMPPEQYAHISPLVLEPLRDTTWGDDCSVHIGSTWTTDAPYRETETAIEDARQRGILAVEMEAAALYAFSAATANPVVCFAHITNEMAQNGNDFEKGQDNGAQSALAVLSTALRCLRSSDQCR